MNDTPLPQLRDQLVDRIPGYERQRQRRRLAVTGVAALSLAIGGLAWGTGRGEVQSITVATPEQTTATSAPTTQTTDMGESERGFFDTTTTTAAPTPTPAELPEDASFTHESQMNLSPEQVDALILAEQFVAALRTRRFADAATMWSGYPDHLQAEDPTADELLVRAIDIEKLVNSEGRWLQSNHLRAFVVHTWSFTNEFEAPIVTVVDFNTDSSMSLLVGGDQIQRIEAPPAPGLEFTFDSPVVAGQVLTVPGIPTEGGAVAFINEGQLPGEIDVSFETLETRITLPDHLPGVFVLTISSATPEISTARSIVLRTPTVQWGCPANDPLNAPDEEFFAIVSERTGGSNGEFVSVDRIEMNPEPSDDEGFFDNLETGLEQLRVADRAEILVTNLANTGTATLVPIADISSYLAEPSPLQGVYRVQTNDDRTIRQLCEVYLP